MNTQSMHAGMYDCMRSESESALGNQLSGRLRKANIHICVSLYVCVYEERERISVTLVTTAAQGCTSDLCTCTRERVCAATTVTVSLPVHIVTQKQHTHTTNTKNTDKYMSSNDRKAFICTGRGKHIKVLTSSAACLGKRRAAPTLFLSNIDTGHQLPWGRSLCGRAAHRRSRR